MAGAFLTDDLDGILRTDEFAETALVTSGDQAGEEIVGVLDNPYADALGVAGNSPVFVARSTPALAQGDALTIAGRGYRVKEPEPDDTGVTRYPLSEA